MTGMDINQLIKDMPSGEYFGIDPGEKGAVVSFFKAALGSASFLWWPTEGIALYKAKAKDWLARPRPVVFVERERATVMMSPKAATTFLTGYGFCLGVIHCLGVEPTLYDPQEWQKIIGLKPLLSVEGKKPTAAQRKMNYTAQMRSLFGEVVEQVPNYAIDAYGILFAGLIGRSKIK